MYFVPADHLGWGMKNTKLTIRVTYMYQMYWAFDGVLFLKIQKPSVNHSPKKIKPTNILQFFLEEIPRQGE